MERDPYEGGSDVGRDDSRATSATSRRRRSATPRRTSWRPSTPTRRSAATARAGATASPADTPEHDWALARALVRPAFRPVGTQGLAIETIDRDNAGRRTRCRATPSRCSTRDRPGCRSSTRSPPAAFDIVVNGDHLLSWGIEPAELQDAAMRNLAAWSADGALERRGRRASGA